MKKRLMTGLAASALMAAMVSVTAGSAFAGEITGNGKDIEVMGKSICAYSGLNDKDPAHHGDTESRVQSWGQLVSTLGLRGGAPGYECRGNVEH
ncbi:MAG: hypothetical protein U9O18_02670 [Chloroflexota bacterium]|nr:hypothetical protein [Chloroflexota bacterium]